jgi:Na+/proline symporter
MVTISKAENITSIADFSAARYGKSALIGGLVTFLSMLIMFPLIAVQLKAVSMSFGMMADPAHLGTSDTGHGILGNESLYVTLFLAVITILFGARQIESSDHNEGLIAVVAFESIVKLSGGFGRWYLHLLFVFSSPGDIFHQFRLIRNLRISFTLMKMYSRHRLVLADAIIDVCLVAFTSPVSCGGGRRHRLKTHRKSYLAVSSISLSHQSFRHSAGLCRKFNF